MGCGGSTVRASTPVGVQNTQFHKENGRPDSAPVTGTQDTKPVRDLQSASTIVIGSRESNSNLNNNNGPAGSEDDNIKSSPKIEIGKVVHSTMSTDSVFTKDEATDTESIVDSQVDDSEQVESTTANQEQRTPHKATEKESSQEHAAPEEATENVTSQKYTETAIATKQQHPDEGDGVSLEVVPAQEEPLRPQSSNSKGEIDQCNSVSKLPKVIVDNSINAAVYCLSLKDSGSEEECTVHVVDHETETGENESETTAAQDSQDNHSQQQQSELTGSETGGNGEHEAAVSNTNNTPECHVSESVDRDGSTPEAEAEKNTIGEEGNGNSVTHLEEATTLASQTRDEQQEEEEDPSQ